MFKILRASRTIFKNLDYAQIALFFQFIQRVDSEVDYFVERDWHLSKHSLKN
jgi:hypothetical protein